MQRRFHRYRHDLRERARELRCDPTAPERRLWCDFLRALPVRFLRQKPLGGYIADFYCARHQLVVEIDGDSHFDPAAARYDDARTRDLAGRGIQVLRFTNAEVMRNFAGVCEAILCALETPTPP